MKINNFAETNDLTKSFQWVENDSLEQHDVQVLSIFYLYFILQKFYS